MGYTGQKWAAINYWHRCWNWLKSARSASPPEASIFIYLFIYEFYRYYRQGANNVTNFYNFKKISHIPTKSYKMLWESMWILLIQYISKVHYMLFFIFSEISHGLRAQSCVPFSHNILKIYQTTCLSRLRTHIQTRARARARTHTHTQRQAYKC